MTHYFSQVSLRKNASSAALAGIFLPEDNDQRVTISHKLLWSLFADAPERQRDFLWRETDKGVFYVLSARPPHDTHALFKIETKEFAPELKEGDRLRFSLRANATVARSGGKGIRGKRSDVVMNAIRPLPPSERAAARVAEIGRAGSAWLNRRATVHGFAIDSVQVDGYRVLRPPHGKSPMRIATLDFSGTLRVTDGGAFIQTLTSGMGRAKAFGCGLLLVRRLR